MTGRLAPLILLAAAVSLYAAAVPTYVGAAACQKCHSKEYQVWSGSRHSKMVQPATTTAVRGDFARGAVELRGQPFRVSLRGSDCYITESYLTGKPVEHHVDYTLGNRRIQHYLTTLPSGRVIVLPPTWDVLRKQWFHAFDIDDPDETSDVMVQVWNKNCYSCHVSQQEKGFDAEKNEYKTTWLNFGTNCERCHGPGSAHVANYSAAVKPAGPARDIVLQTRLDPARNTMVCAQCHSFRDIYAQGYRAGADYYDHFLPILEYSQPEDKDPAYWPDGRTRRFSNDAFGLWQSECFLKGNVTCVGCHAAAHETEIERNSQLRPDANALCTRCHESLGKNVAAHTHHTATSTGSSCVECHMPRTVLSIKAEIRDHSMTVPVPENTIAHAIPNACNVCHKDRDAAWALKQMNAWYGAVSRQKWIQRADAFALARTGNAAAVPLLLKILAAPSEGPLARGNAVGYLSRFTNDPEVYSALEAALTDPQPLVRAVTALRLNPPASQRTSAMAALTRALADATTTVRVGAAVTMVGMGIARLDGADGERLESAKQIYRARAALNSDDAMQQLGAGKFYLLTGDPISALGALETSLKLDPEVPARYLLAYAHAQQGQYQKAREVLQTIAPTDAQYGRAQELLRAIAGR
ncbi:Tetratricopeptide TPR_4 [Candidatus Sulfopaludibacter sp. SbA3]|nr:Tetratricopeptide TPR_4 [Candidatus Sulfopaludibacter sp. SbA3]